MKYPVADIPAAAKRINPITSTTPRTKRVISLHARWKTLKRRDQQSGHNARSYGQAHQHPPIEVGVGIRPPEAARFGGNAIQRAVHGGPPRVFNQRSGRSQHQRDQREPPQSADRFGIRRTHSNLLNLRERPMHPIRPSARRSTDPYEPRADPAARFRRRASRRGRCGCRTSVPILFGRGRGVRGS